MEVENSCVIIDSNWLEKGSGTVSEVKSVHEIPVQILQEFIVILRTNEKFIGEGKVENYYLIKNETHAAIIYDNGDVSYIANFTKDKLGNWFFNSKISVRDSLKGQIKGEIVKEFFPEPLNEEIKA